MRTLSVVALVLSTGLAASAQSVISAHSGVLHVSEGTVLLDGKEVNQKYGTFPDIKENSKLTTASGRAEILLTPGVFLRIGDNSGMKMITNRLIDTRVELLSGKAMLESDSPMKDTAVTVIYGDYQVHVRKASVFEIETNPAQLKVYHGEAEVEARGETTVVRAGRLLPFGRAMVSEKFNPKEGDELAQWSMQRSQTVAVANVSGAKSMRDSGGSFGPNGGWFFNPYYSMFTYIPGGGTFWNPYGYGFWSPGTVNNVYYGGYGGGYGGGYYDGRNGGGYSGGSTIGRTGDTSGSFEPDIVRTRFNRIVFECRILQRFVRFVLRCRGWQRWLLRRGCRCRRRCRSFGWWAQRRRTPVSLNKNFSLQPELVCPA